MSEKHCFVAVEFVDDPNVVGYCYWYFCDFPTIKAGDIVVAPLGKHNNTQEGVVRSVIFETKENSPFPFEYIKRIRSFRQNK